VNEADTTWIADMKKPEERSGENDESHHNQFPEKNEEPVNNDAPITSSPSSADLFYFDPNSLDQNGWKKLGLKDRTISIITNYLTKGGHFYKTEDLKKIYGLRADDYTRLAPYVKIEGSNQFADKKSEYAKKEFQPARPSYNVIDINTADTSAFIALPGIGAKLAMRIVNFRDKLGGFYSIDQVSETYGLADSVFQKIKQYFNLKTISIKKININTATVEELKAHPYLRYQLANSIIAYRKEHGPFSKLEDIKQVMTITDDIFNKIVPYLALQ